MKQVNAGTKFVNFLEQNIVLPHETIIKFPVSPIKPLYSNTVRAKRIFLHIVEKRYFNKFGEGT